MFKQPLWFLQRRFLKIYFVEVRCLSNRSLLIKGGNYYSLKLLFTKEANLLSTDRKNYAKNCNIKKEKQKKIKVDESELREYFDVEKLLSDIQNPLKNFKEELMNHATLRSSPNTIEKLKINFEGNICTIQDLAKVGKKNPSLYVLDFSSFPSTIPTVMNTLQKSELNINPQQDGTRVFVPIPKVTKEYREILAKKIKLYFFKCKEGIREVQMKYTKSLANIDKLSTEAKFRITQQLTALGDQQILVAEEILKKKQEELLKDQ